MEWTRGSPAGSRCRCDPGESWRFRPAFQVRRFAGSALLRVRDRRRFTAARPVALRVPVGLEVDMGPVVESVKVGCLEVTPIVGAEGTFATVREVFPTLTDELEAEARARAPELFRGVRTRRRFLGELADEGVPVTAAHLYGVGRFVRDGEAFGGERAKEDGAPVE